MRNKREFVGGKAKKNHILNFVKIEAIPEINREEFIKAVEWFPLKEVKKGKLI